MKPKVTSVQLHPRQLAVLEIVEEKESARGVYNGKGWKSQIIREAIDLLQAKYDISDSEIGAKIEATP